MPKKNTINEKEAFEFFFNYDLEKLLSNYPYTKEEKKDKKVLRRNLRSKWLDTLKRQGIEQNQNIEGGDNASVLLFFFILKLNGAHHDEAINLPQNKAVLEEAMKALGYGVNQKRKLIRRPQQLNRQLTKYNKNGQIAFNFEELPDSTKTTLLSDINKKGLDDTEVIELINERGEALPFSTGHFQLIDTLMELLNLKSSNTTRKDDDDYFSGEGKPMKGNLGGELAIAPNLNLTLYEIAKKFNGDKRPSKNVKEQVSKLINELGSDKEYFATIKTITEIKKSKNTNRIIETLEYSPLIRSRLVRATYLDRVTRKIISRTKDILVITLHPLFVKDIATRFILEPDGITALMKAASPSRQISEVSYRLRYYLSERLSFANGTKGKAGDTKSYLVKITTNNLYWRLNEKYMKESRKYLIKGQLEIAITTMQNLGLLSEVTTEISKTTGEQMHVFKLNKDWV